MPVQKTLYLLRHAKAEAGSSSKDDHERGLTGRGVRASEAVGKYMAEQGINPQKILCSTAVRARGTLTALFTFIPKGVGNIEYTGKLYLASANEALQLIAGAPEDVQSLMIVGHNPGLHQLAAALAKAGDTALLARLRLKFPTCTLATIIFHAAWKDIGRARGTLEGFVMPETAGGSD